MTLKQHNDIVEKLLNQIDAKDKQIEVLKKQAAKASNHNVQPRTKIADAQKQASRKVAQLHKEYKQKISQLTQQIRSKSHENKDLKERLAAAKNIQAKQKQQIAEVLKKTASMAAYDPKMAALVSHYELQIEKKNKHIAGLQQQVRENYYAQTKRDGNTRQGSTGGDGCESENDEPVPQNMIPAEGGIPRSKDHLHTKYQQEIASLRESNLKYQRLLEQKSKQFKDLSKRYSELTKEYYKLLNEYGETQTGGTQKTDPGKHENWVHFAFADNLRGQQPVESITEPSLSFSFTSNYSKLKANPQATLVQSPSTGDTATIDQVMQMLGVSSRVQIVTALSKIKASNEQSRIYENISQFVHAMLYRLGMGKLPMSKVILQLEKLQVKINKYAQASDLLDEVCIQAGAKREKLLERLGDMKASQQQLLANLRDIAFMQRLPRANKVLEFIEYFELDREACELPEQLKRMYEQLKCVDRFLKQASLLLGREGEALDKFFGFCLRYLERAEAERTAKGEEKGNKQRIPTKSRT